MRSAQWQEMRRRVAGWPSFVRPVSANSRRRLVQQISAIFRLAAHRTRLRPNLACRSARHYNPELAMTEIPPQLLAALQGIASELFQAGVKVGAEQMRAAILDLASTPFGDAVHSREHVSQSERREMARERRASTNTVRAPRGSVRTAVRAALQATPGLNEFDLGQAAERIDPSVSPRSIGGELRRMRDRLYRIDGGRWFLIAQEGEKEAAGRVSEPADLLNRTAEGVPNGTPVVT